MPRRKKNGQSPARVPGGPPASGSLVHNTGYRHPPGLDDAMANNFPSSTTLSSSVKEEMVTNMQEMFSHLDPEVIYIVLSECDFKVESAMDSLLELSVAAEGAAPIPSPVSGFESSVAALLNPHQFSESKPAQLLSSSPSTSLLTEELDLLVDQELESLSMQEDMKDGCHCSQNVSSFPPLPLPQQVLPELLQSSLQPGSKGPPGGLVEHICVVPSDETAEEQPSMVDYSSLMVDSPAHRLKPPLNLASAGRPSAFQVYKKQEPSHPSDKSGVLSSKAECGGTSSEESRLNQEPLGSIQPPWNLEAPVFSPHVHENQGPAFITPVAHSPSIWTGQPRHPSPWLSQGRVSQAPLKPNATIPKSWALPAPQPPAQYSRVRLQGRVLVLLRGAPGCGKSTLARALAEHNPGAVVLSTDDYFTSHGAYQFDPSALGEAHEWNQKRAKEAFEQGANPIIIDNTNMQGWEMRPYVVQALKHGYKVLFREPDTWWKNKPRELQRRTTHNVPLEKIRHMLNGYERFVSVQSIIGSQMPEFKQRPPLDNDGTQPVSSAAPCPDLVEQPGLTQGSKKSHPQLFSSLPDVSSIGRSSEVETLEDGAISTESLNFQPTGRHVENPEMSDKDNDMDLGELESDAQFDINHPAGDQRMPDCIVESVMNEEHDGDERPVAFSESIGQRVRRERPSRRSGFDRLEPADLVKDTNQSDSETEKREKRKEKVAEGVELGRDGEGKGIPKMLDFFGDWPTEGSLEQRPVRSREEHKKGNGKEDERLSQEVNKNTTKVQPGPNKTEFQKLLDLIQTGEADIHAGSSPLSSPSSSLEGELDKGEEDGVRFDESQSSRSNSKERAQGVKRGDNSSGELPDCVLDWKAAHSQVKESRSDHWEGFQYENEERSSTAGNETASLGLKSTQPPVPLSALTADVVISETVEANVPEGVGSHTSEEEGCTEPSTGPTDVDTNDWAQNREARSEGDGHHISEVRQSPVCDDSVEAECGAYSGGSQERKQRQGRRSGKHCKLALTFTQNCPASSLNTTEYPSVTSQNVNSQKSIDAEAGLNPDSNSYTSCSLKPNVDLFPESKPEAQVQPPSPLPPVDNCCPTQTDPQDFAFLWRINHQGNQNKPAVPTNSQPCNMVVLSCDSSRFVPQQLAAGFTAVHPSGHREVPYRVVHEKGTQVEEKELGATQDRLESLRILSRHFRLVSFDTLEDLYEKCHQDLDWTTNLLLDSGEMFFKDEDSEKEEDGAGGEEDQNTSSLCAASGKSVETSLCPDVMDKHHPGLEAGTLQSAFGTDSDESSSNSSGLSFGGALVPGSNKDRPDTTSHTEKSPQTELRCPQVVNKGEGCGDAEHKVEPENDHKGNTWGGSFSDRLLIEESGVKTKEEIASMEEVHRLLQAELDKIEKEERQKEEEERLERRRLEEGRSRHLDIQSVELKLPTEVALQLTELFGPVGVDPGTCPADDFAVQMDLSLAKLLHQKWKQTIQEKQRKAAHSFHLLQEGSVQWADSHVARTGSRDRTQLAPASNRAGGYVSLDGHPEAGSQMPFMDHWNASHPHISLRDIIKEEQALQNIEKTRRSRADLDQRDGATLLKEDQLYSLFPAIDRHFLQDIFREHNYSLTQTELFLHSLLDEEPVKTVVAPEVPRSEQHRATSKEREMKQKPLELIQPDYQDTEDPQYEDFRAEANLQRCRQLESFSKAAEAFKQGRKEVASFYAQQGHMHGKRMREANHRAAVQIFERVNSSLLPKNILDLHGLHVDEALRRLAQVLHDKTTACEQGLCRPRLSVITGRGNHSQGGVARIRPAVIDYLTNKHYRFTEPQPGHVLVSLK